MVSLKFEKKGSIGLLKLQGNVNVTEAGDLKEALLKALGRSDTVFFDMTEVTGVDISCLQLLCSAHRTSVRLNKALKWKSPVPPVFDKHSDEAGFFRHVGCHLDTEKSCIWVKG